MKVGDLSLSTELRYSTNTTGADLSCTHCNCAVLHVYFGAASIQGQLLLNFKAFGCGFYSRAASI